MSYATSWQCVPDLVITGATDCTVLSTSSDPVATSSSSVCGTSSTTACYFYANDITFGLAIIIVLGFLMVSGFTYNKLSRKDNNIISNL